VKLHLRYVPAVPVTLACQLALYVDLDPTDDADIITDADALIRQAVAQTGGQQWNFHTPKVIPMAMRSDQQFYFTGEDRLNERFTLQGKAYLIQVTQAVDVSGQPISADINAGSIFIDWTVDFNIPQINPESTILSTAVQTRALQYVRVGGWDTEASWRPSFDGILNPNTVYTICLCGEFTSIPTTGGTSVRLSLAGTGAQEIVTPTGTSVIQLNNAPVVIKTNALGKPQQDIQVTRSSSWGGLVNEAGLWIRPVFTRGKFAIPTSRVVEHAPS
jgi:hypothetical protein